MTTTAELTFEERRLVAMLDERGVTDSRDLVTGAGDLEAIRGAIRWFDDMPPGKAGTGLLVKKIRDGDMANYRRVGTRHDVDEGEDSGIVSRELCDSIRAQCLIPDGMTRVQAYDQFARCAARLRVGVDALLDAAGLGDWYVTPPHPASLRSGFAAAPARYPFWVAQEHRRPPHDPVMGKIPGESDESWSLRYWDWEDTEEVSQAILRSFELRAERERRAREARDAEMAERAARAQARQALRTGEAMTPEDLHRADEPAPDDDEEDF